MNKNERAAWIAEKLAELYPAPPIPLQHKDPYTLLVAVLLSAQCTDERVNKVTPDLWKLADNPFDMAKVPAETIEVAIKSCGLSPQKSRAIHQLSNILVREHSGIVPDNFTDLEKLPGVGHKTHQRQKCGTNRGRPEKTVSTGNVECLASADHLLWP